MSKYLRNRQEQILKDHLAMVEEKAHAAIRNMECPDHRWSPRIRASEMGVHVVQACCREFERDVNRKIAEAFDEKTK